MDQETKKERKGVMMRREDGQEVMHRRRGGMHKGGMEGMSVKNGINKIG